MNLKVVTAVFVLSLSSLAAIASNKLTVDTGDPNLSGIIKYAGKVGISPERYLYAVSRHTAHPSVYQAAMPTIFERDSYIEMENLEQDSDEWHRKASQLQNEIDVDQANYYGLTVTEYLAFIKLMRSLEQVGYQPDPESGDPLAGMERLVYVCDEPCGSEMLPVESNLDILALALGKGIPYSSTTSTGLKYPFAVEFVSPETNQSYRTGVFMIVEHIGALEHYDLNI